MVSLSKMLPIGWLKPIIVVSFSVLVGVFDGFYMSKLSEPGRGA